jgi:hypothetical protein
MAGSRRVRRRRLRRTAVVSKSIRDVFTNEEIRVAEERKGVEKHSRLPAWFTTTSNE